jgi:small GTP-binding protein
LTHSLRKYTFKVIFLGDAAVGKTSIVARHVTSTFEENYIPSIGANITSRDYSINGKDITLMIWDIAAQEGFSKVRYDYYQGARAAFMVYDVTRPGTFEDIVFWLDDLKKAVRKKIPMILIGNKIDLPDVVHVHSGQRLADDIGADFIETSAKTGQNIEEAFGKIAKKLSEASST